jgi:hypothetical protein
LDFSAVDGQGLLIHDYANRNSHFIYGPDCPTTVPYQHNTTPDVLDIVFIKDFVLPTHLPGSPLEFGEHIFLNALCLAL